MKEFKSWEWLYELASKLINDSVAPEQAEEIIEAIINSKTYIFVNNKNKVINPDPWHIVYCTNSENTDIYDE